MCTIEDLLELVFLKCLLIEMTYNRKKNYICIKNEHLQKYSLFPSFPSYIYLICNDKKSNPSRQNKKRYLEDSERFILCKKQC